MKKKHRERTFFFFFFCVDRVMPPTVLSKNKMSCWASNLETPTLLPSIILNLAPWVKKLCFHQQMLMVKMVEQQSGRSLYESQTPTLLPYTLTHHPTPTRSLRQHQLPLYLTSHITANSYINAVFRRSRGKWDYFWSGASRWMMLLCVLLLCVLQQCALRNNCTTASLLLSVASVSPPAD